MEDLLHIGNVDYELIGYPNVEKVRVTVSTIQSGAIQIIDNLPENWNRLSPKSIYCDFTSNQSLELIFNIKYEYSAEEAISSLNINVTQIGSINSYVVYGFSNSKDQIPVLPFKDIFVINDNLNSNGFQDSKVYTYPQNFNQNNTHLIGFKYKYENNDFWATNIFFYDETDSEYYQAYHILFHNKINIIFDKSKKGKIYFQAIFMKM